MHGRGLLKSFGRWSIGTDHGVNITQHIWVFNGDKAILEEGSSLTQVNELINNAPLSWDLNAICDNLTTQLAIIAIKTPISWSHPWEELYWPYTKMDITLSSVAIGVCWTLNP